MKIPTYQEQLNRTYLASGGWTRVEDSAPEADMWLDVAGPVDGPAQLLTLGALKSPDEALGHEARHALQRWRHAAFLSNSEGVCVE